MCDETGISPALLARDFAARELSRDALFLWAPKIGEIRPSQTWSKLT